MAKHQPWKDLERRHAKRMNGVRLWRPGFSDTQPDGENDYDVWDTKCFARFSIVTLFEECERKYRAFTGNRRFTLVLFSRDKPRAGDFVLVRAQEYADDRARLQELERWFKAHQSTALSEPGSGVQEVNSV